MGSSFQIFRPLLVCLGALCASAEPASSLDALIELNHFKRARAIVEARLRADPNDAQSYAWLSKIRISFGDLDGAVTAAERAVALAPANATYHGMLAEACALLADQSSILRGLTYVHRMKKEIDAALALDPRHIDTLLVEMMFDWKAPALAGGDRRKAVRIADQILGIDPVWGCLAHARLLQDEDDDATTEGWLRRAIQAAPNFYRARISLARFYCCTARNKHLDLAERAALDALNLDPAVSGAYVILARVYALQQRWADLENTVTRAARAVPEDLGAYEAAARALLESGQDFRRAERYLGRYLSQPPEGRQPTLAEARAELATLHRREGGKADVFLAAPANAR